MRVNSCRVAFVAMYGSSFGIAQWYCPDVNSTTRPPGRPSCCAANCWTSSSVARVLIAWHRSSSSAVSSARVCSLLRAWLATIASTCPNWFTAAWITRAGASGSAKSSCTNACPPAARPDLVDQPLGETVVRAPRLFGVGGRPGMDDDGGTVCHDAPHQCSADADLAAGSRDEDDPIP